jgi:L-seryl-tRNA(Ser) seleniumtransferase
MAPKPLDFLNRIPNVSELLEKQPLRTLSDRLNRSVVASGVRSFLEELRTDLQRRAAEVPTIRELAERAARYVVSHQQTSQRAIINATGRIIGSPWVNVPLADHALERALQTGRNFVLAPGAETNARSPLSADAEALACRLTGAQAAIALHSYAGALWLTLAALATDREVLVSRADVGDVDSAGPLPKLAASARAHLKDVGTANRTAACDYEAAASPRASILLRLNSDDYRIVGETAAAELEELIAIARDRELVLVDAAGAAPLTDPPSSISWPRQSVRAKLAAGVDLVLVRGDGLIGGPSCGILAGRQEIVRRIAEHPLLAAWKLDALRLAALAGTLECYENSPPGEPSLPVWQCLAAPIENLRNRAERLAPQLAAADGIAAAVAVETRSPIAAAIVGGGWPSYGIVLTPKDADAARLERRMTSAAQPVVGRIENDGLVLDLRTVFPRQDKSLVEALAGTTIPSEAVANVADVETM